MIEKYLEATILKEDIGWKELRAFTQNAEAKQYLGICTYMNYSAIITKYAKTCKKIYVIGFPFGDPKQIDKDLVMMSDVDDEYDVVVPISLIIMKKYKQFKKIMDIVRKATKGKTLKAIIETAYLTEEKFKPVITICEKCGVDIIKTNTGRFKRIRELEQDIELIKKYTKLPIKASGGISTYEQVKKLIDLGVSRIGCSNPDKILEEEVKANEVNELGRTNNDSK